MATEKEELTATGTATSTRLDETSQSSQSGCSLVSSDVVPDAVTATESGNYQCPICGRKFKSIGSLKGHIVRVHRRNPTDVLGSEEEAPASRPRSVGESGLEREPEPLPTLADHLLKVLELSGIKGRAAEAVVEICRNRGFDIQTLEYALMQATIPYDKRKLAIELWATKLGEEIPHDIAVRYNIAPYRFYSYQYPPHRSPSPPANPAQSVIEAKTIEVLGQVVNTLLTTTLNRPQPNYDNGIIKELIESNRRLQMELAKMREELYKKDLEYLKREIDRLSKEKVGRSEWDFLTEMLKNIGSKTEKLVSLYEYVVKASLTPAEPIPEKYKQAPPQTSQELLEELEAAGLVESEEPEGENK